MACLEDERGREKGRERERERDLGEEVGCGATFHGDLTIGDDLQKAFVFNQLCSVADSMDTARENGVFDALPSCTLSRMKSHIETVLANDAERFRVIVRTEANLCFEEKKGK
jgi:hypothetical protein